MLGAADIRRVVEAIVAAKKRNGGVVWGIGAHVIKTGLSPVLIDLMERGFVSAVAMNGAGIIHDFEVALAGATSEDVDEALGPARFGMAEETGTLLNEAIRAARIGNKGLGQGVASFLAERQPRWFEKRGSRRSSPRHPFDPLPHDLHDNVSAAAWRKSDDPANRTSGIGLGHRDTRRRRQCCDTHRQLQELPAATSHAYPPFAAYKQVRRTSPEWS